MNTLRVNMTIQDQLKEARTKAGLSQSQLGALIGVARENVSMYENGKKENPTVELLEKWATATGYTFVIGPAKS